METKTCAECQAPFSTRDKRRKYCGVPCYSAIRARRRGGVASFPKGHRPWNKNKKTGIRKSKATEFVPGGVPHNALPVGTITVRPDKSGKMRKWIKLGPGRSRWIENARHVWEKENGKPSAGLVIHHIDGDAMNDRLSNLCALTRAAHLKIHKVSRW